MNHNKIGICTVYTGYNYGSTLQAYATKKIIKKMGYKPEIIKISGSLIEGRDVRPWKMFVIAIRSLVYYKAGKKAISSYHTTINAKITNESKELFQQFYNKKIIARKISYSYLKKIAQTSEYGAFVCGSDQVWNATSMYIDPFYYLSFAPQYKRIAFAPSFGKNTIPYYNRNVIRHKIEKIPYLSVRELRGQRIIRSLTNREAVLLLDPTLVLNMGEWKTLLNLNPTKGNYCLAYFLDKPNTKAINAIKRISDTGMEIKFIPYSINSKYWNTIDAGPIEFLNLILGANLILTDSFHGTAFSINFEKNFYSFGRTYGSAANQSSRLLSLLNKLNLTNRYDPSDIQFSEEINYNFARNVLDNERMKSYRYLESSFEKVFDNGR